MSLRMEEKAGVRLAVEGCGHGTLHAIYASIAEACGRKGWSGIDLLIIGGDFQAVRNAYDLNCVSMPAKYRSMCDFHEYYSGLRTAPYLTIFIGGNHEASNYLFELYYGGWVAPNIYYMGAANVLRLGPLRIAGMSGIWKGYNYRKPHHERLPYNESDLRSIYHVRELDVRKLLQIRTQIDIGISHDWPKGVERWGDWKQLFRFKKHLQEDSENGQLGSVAAQEVLAWLRPKWWFSAHLHCKFAAVVDHAAVRPKAQLLADRTNGIQSKNEDEIDLVDDMDVDGGVTTAATAHTNGIDLGLDADLEPAALLSETNGDSHAVEAELKAAMVSLESRNDLSGSELPKNLYTQSTLSTLGAARAALPDSFRRSPPPEPTESPPAITNDKTEFLALDKCLPGKHFLQLIDVPCGDDPYPRPLRLEYDREWLAITRAFALDEPTEVGDPDSKLTRASKPASYAEMIDKCRMWIDENIKNSDLIIPEDFEITAPVYDNGDWNLPQYSQVREYPNPQTERFCKMLEILNPFNINEVDILERLAAGPRDDPQSARPSNFSRRGRGGRSRGGGPNRGRHRGR